MVQLDQINVLNRILKAVREGVLPPRLAALRTRLLASNTGRRLASGAFWSLLASVASRSFGLFSSIIIARLLGKETFGELGIIQSTLDMFGTIAGFSMGLTSTKYVAECRSQNPLKAGRIIAISSLVAWVCGGITVVVLVSLAPWLANKTIAAPQLAGLLQVSAFSLLFGAVNGAQIGALSGFEAFRRVAQVNLISGLLTFLFRVSGTVAFGLQGAVYGMVLAQAAGCAINYAVLRQVATKAKVAIQFRHCLKELPVLWKFSLPTVLGSLVALPVTWICNAMLVNQPGGYAEMGIFNAANQWFFIILFIPGLLGQAAMPVLFERINAGDHRESVKIFLTLLKINTIVFLPVILVGCFSRTIMACYGSGFSNGWPTMVLSVVTAGLMALQMPAGYMIAAKNKMWIMLLMNAGWGAVFIGANELLVRRGAFGLALAKLIAVCLHSGWSFGYVLHTLRNHEGRGIRDLGVGLQKAEIIEPS